MSFPIANVCLAAGLAVAAPAPEDVAEDAPPQAEVPTGLTLPRIVRNAELTYPTSMLDADTPPEGTVVYRYTVGVGGEVLTASVVHSVHPVLDLIALEALLRSEHAPGTYEGKPVEVTTKASFVFEAPAPTPAPVLAPSPDPDPESQSEPLPAVASLPIVATGRLLEAGKRTPVSGAAVVATPGQGLPQGRISKRDSKAWREANPDPAWSVDAETDADGRFSLRGVPDGPVLVTFISQGFERLEVLVMIAEGSIVEGTYYQVRDASNPYRTVVQSEHEAPAIVTRRTATKLELAQAPGSQGDAVRGIVNFPGVARTPFGLGALVIRGAAPGDSAVYLGGHEIPTVFHFGGLRSTFNSELLRSIDYIPGNFDARYGDATGGVVSLVPRAPKDDGFHGHIDTSVIDVGALAEGGIGRGSYAAAVRRSTIDLVLGAVDGVPVSPMYWDYQGLFEHPVGKGRVGTRLFGSIDKLVALDEDLEGFTNDTAYHRGDVYYTRRDGPWSFEVSEAFSFTDVDNGANPQRDYTFSTRGEARVRASKRLGFVFGTETRVGWADLEFTQPPNAFGGMAAQGSETEGISQQTAVIAIPTLYGAANIRLAKQRPVTLSPGIRVTGYVDPLGMVTADPRLNATWQATDRLTLKAGVGLYSQSPTLAELDGVFGNPELLAERSLQTSAGGQVALPYDMSLDVTVFYKDLWDLAIRSTATTERGGDTVPENFASVGRGRSYGAEVLFRRDFSKKLYGWVAYTLSRTEQRDPGEAYTLSLLDQSHILTVLGGYKLPRNWNIGFRFRLTSGNPTTPTANGIYDATTGSWTAFAAPENSGRLPAFHQLDLRIDKTWTFQKSALKAYLDVQNLYNAQNAEFIINAYDFTESARVVSLPIYPAVGVRFEW